jgi:hypothetical protein
MKKHVIRGPENSSVTILEPENSKDIQEIARLDAAGKVDTKSSFSDYKEDRKRKLDRRRPDGASPPGSAGTAGSPKDRQGMRTGSRGWRRYSPASSETS